MRTKNEAYNLIDKARETDGTYNGMSYEQGIIDALEWLIGDVEDNPLED